MKKYKIILNNIEDIKKFVSDMNTQEIDVDVSINGRRQIVDGKSILGVIAIASNSPLDVTLYSEEKEKVFDEVMQQFNIVNLVE